MGASLASTARWVATEAGRNPAEDSIANTTPNTPPRNLRIADPLNYGMTTYHLYYLSTSKSISFIQATLLPLA
jgi:hypothetical protein